MHKDEQHDQGVIWDLDGTLVDTSALHFTAWERVAKERGHPFTHEDFHRTFGRRNPEILGILFGEGLDKATMDALGDHKEELFRTAVREQGVKLLPHALELVKQLHDAGFKQAIGSSAPKANIELLAEVAGLMPYIKGIVAMEDTQRGKPDPEVFLKAAGKLAVLPGWCVVVEDAVFGVEAAKAAHMYCIAVRGGGHSTDSALREAKADMVVEWLSEVTVQQFKRLVR
jgi:beta-phosphoglucomutase